MTGRTILTAAEMSAAEAEAIAAGTSVGVLMERAGRGAAEAIWRFAGPMPALVLCGPGNNGGDGYVIARALAERGLPVRVAALADPTSEAARAACAAWGGRPEEMNETAPAPLLIDALFGTGLGRPLDDALAARLATLAEAARVKVAVDLPSGAATDDGTLLSPVRDFDLTITFQTLKPSHLLQPAARHMGRIVVADIGIEATSELAEIGRPRLVPPGPADHKYTRGLVTVVAGGMAGAVALAATAASRAGAGTVRLQARQLVPGLPAAVVQAPGDPLARLDDNRIDALLLGPGMLPGDDESMLEAVLGSGHPLVLDAGALRMLSSRLERLAGLKRPAILTPHEGEFVALFGDGGGGKVERARAAAARAGAVIVYKGPDTVVAAPGGRAAIAASAHPWLASAGTGDVYAGIAAARYAAHGDAFAAACEAVWLHGRAAERAGPGLIADDLIAQLPATLAECL
ncbi:MAG: NAD(P)H-hydrate dehydratase [Sphingomonas sp.]